SATFNFKVQDDGGATGPDTSTAAAVFTVNITAVNDPPVGLTGSVTTLEDSDIFFTRSNIASTTLSAFDPNDNPPTVRAGTTIGTLPTTAPLYLGTISSPVTAGQFINAGSIAQLGFHPATDLNGSPLTSFLFQVKDLGLTANGGIDTDPSPK